jgi:S-adenosyl-L-methionine hydrolase (adenosine-forming)
MSAPIVLLTDFGYQDPYAGIMKGVIAQIAPDAETVDLTHDIPPGDVLRAAMTLWQSYLYFPNGTIFLSVVDPGVGTSRRPVIIRTATANNSSYTLIGPDNGLFTFVLEEGWQAWEIDSFDYVLPNRSHTFHGRDVFAPAAAHAWRGVFGDEFGPEVKELALLPQPRLKAAEPAGLEGEVLYADRFGNLLTSLGRFDWAGSEKINFYPWLPGSEAQSFTVENLRLVLPGGQELLLVKTFQDAPEGGCAALAGSTGLLEIVSNRRSAADLLILDRGSRIMLVNSAE